MYSLGARKQDMCHITQKVALAPLSPSVRFCIKLSCCNVDASACSDLLSHMVVQLLTPSDDWQGPCNRTSGRSQPFTSMMKLLLIIHIAAFLASSLNDHLPTKTVTRSLGEEQFIILHLYHSNCTIKKTQFFFQVTLFISAAQILKLLGVLLGKQLEKESIHTILTLFLTSSGPFPIKKKNGNKIFSYTDPPPHTHTVQSRHDKSDRLLLTALPLY